MIAWVRVALAGLAAGCLVRWLYECNVTVTVSGDSDSDSAVPPAVGLNAATTARSSRVTTKAKATLQLLILGENEVPPGMR